jgi:hypothetical protein
MDDFDPNSTGARLRRAADEKLDMLGIGHARLSADIHAVDGRLVAIESKVMGVVTTQAVHEEILRNADTARREILGWQQVNGPKIETSARSMAMAARLLWIIVGSSIAGGASFFALLFSGVFKKWLHIP